MDRLDIPFTLLKRWLVAVPVAALCAASPAGAVVIVGVEAGSQGNGPYAIDNENPSLPQTTKAVSAAAGANAAGSGVPFNDAILNPGPLPGCAASCASLPGGSTGLARAEANGLTGELKVRVEAYNQSSFGSAFAALQDTITFLGAKEVNLEVDLDAFTATSANRLEFFFSLGFFDNSDPDNPFTPVYLFESDETGYAVTLFNPGGNGTTIDSGTIVPNSFDASVDLAPFLLFGQTTAPLQVNMTATAVCGGSASCVAQVLADNSLHLTIDGPYVSAEGYNYDALVVAVQEPASALALAGSLAGLWWSRRRRATSIGA